jgi:hypothetical protein
MKLATSRIMKSEFVSPTLIGNTWELRKEIIVNNYVMSVKCYLHRRQFVAFHFDPAQWKDKFMFDKLWKPIVI